MNESLVEEALKLLVLRETLVEENLSCIAQKPNGQIVKETGTGIAPTIRLLESGVLPGSIVVDKIIGKAAAMLLTLGEVRFAHGVVMSNSAFEWLEGHSISASYDTLVDFIVNRVGNGVCPMEETVQGVSDEKIALSLLKKKIEELKAKR